MQYLARLAYEWACRCFGKEHVHDHQVRALRIVEEAIELCQAEGINIEKVRQVTEIVYSRPRGDWYQEAGGLLMTTAVYVESRGSMMERILLNELSRVLAKPADHFAKRNREKIDLGLTGSSGR
jgi:hypothetical protein